MRLRLLGVLVLFCLSTSALVPTFAPDSGLPQLSGSTLRVDNIFQGGMNILLHVEWEEIALDEIEDDAAWLALTRGEAARRVGDRLQIESDRAPAAVASTVAERLGRYRHVSSADGVHRFALSADRLDDIRSMANRRAEADVRDRLDSLHSPGTVERWGPDSLMVRNF